MQLEASEYYLPLLDRRRLADCCWAVGTPLTGAHSALGDARATAGLLAAFLQSGVRPALPEHLQIPSRALSTPWPSGPSRSPGQWQPAQSQGALSDRAYQVMARTAAAEPPKALVELVERFSLADALDEGAPAGTMAYLEKLAEVLEDGEVTTEEAAALAELADAEQLTDADIASANQAFVLALAYEALDDGKVTRAERAELQTVSDLLGVNPKIIPGLLERAESARNQRLSAGLAELPTDWPHGEPLRVGDKVVFTGCDDQIRARLEQQSEKLGVRIVGSVSAKTAMLVSDGTMDGTKAARARELGTRTVHPGVYALLLDHLQPALERVSQAAPKVPSPRTAEVAAEAAAAGDTRSAPNPAAVRAWARANGYEVGVRGRIQKEIIHAFEAAQLAP